VFHPLDQEHIKKIVGVMLKSLQKRLEQNGITMQVSDEAIAHLAQKGFDPVFGARPLRRAIQTMVEDKFAEQMLEGTVKSGDTVNIGFDGTNLVFETRSSASQKAEQPAQ